MPRRIVDPFEEKKHELAAIIKKERVGQGLTQTKLGRMARVQQSRISQIESFDGFVTFDIYLRLLNILGVGYEIRVWRGWAE